MKSQGYASSVKTKAALAAAFNCTLEPKSHGASSKQPAMRARFKSRYLLMVWRFAKEFDKEEGHGTVKGRKYVLFDG